jgi:hypothetical protein
MKTKFTLKRVLIDNIIFIILFGVMAIWGDIERWDVFLPIYFSVVLLTWVVYFVENRKTS